ncbi:MAG TPA: sigma-54 dependent transcriptional regulator [Thermoanaerobaculia bacterium]|nr:sigma-54 dependent transcriptional regulator [Thermoanaerobaculia bacterium]
MTARILLIDDENVFREDVAALLRHEGYTCETASNGAEGLRCAEAEAPDVILCDLVMPGVSGTELVARLVALCPDTAILVITAHATVETTVGAFRAGAVDYLLKPIVAEDLFQKVSRAVEERQLQRELRYLRREISRSRPGTTIVGNSRGIEAVREMIERVADSTSSVLITGESGTGKELVARAIHERSPRGKGPFIAVNCAALPHDLAESELFGHVRGAFTGALRDKPGYFELAGGGTLFLDEICELSPELQAKLLRAIDQQEIFRVGGTRQIRTDVRIVAATNRNVKTEIEEKRFREDLYFRISVIEIALPPLRERRDDIPIIVEHLLHRLSAELKRHVSGLSNPALRALMSAPWRGNVRELENVLERAILLSDNGSIDVGNLPAELAGSVPLNGSADDLRLAVRAYEREHIRQVLSSSGGNREEASRRLGIDASTLYRRMKELNL